MRSRLIAKDNVCEFCVWTRGEGKIYLLQLHLRLIPPSLHAKATCFSAGAECYGFLSVREGSGVFQDFLLVYSMRVLSI